MVISQQLQFKIFVLLGGPKNQDFLQIQLSAIQNKPGINLNAKNTPIICLDSWPKNKHPFSLLGYWLSEVSLLQMSIGANEPIQLLK